MVDKQRILVVDDSYFNVKIMEEILQEDYEVATARSGQECLDYMTAEGADLIFLDIVMKGMDGYDVCQELKENPMTRNVPIVFVSAHDDMENQIKGLGLGAMDYIVRPVQPAVVKAKAKNYLAMKRHQDMLAGFSFNDGLTGIFNRRYFNECLAREWKEAFRLQQPIVAVFADVDYFKKFNDFYGHLAGDECLRKIAGTLASSLKRPRDVAARYGGEEFMIILPGTDLAGAIKVSERIQQGLAQLKMKHEKSEVNPYVTLSMGIASTIPKERNREKELVEMADIALYKAKDSGRNTYKCFEKPSFGR